MGNCIHAWGVCYDVAIYIYTANIYYCTSLANIPPIFPKCGILIPYLSSSIFIVLISSSVCVCVCVCACRWVGGWIQAYVNQNAFYGNVMFGVTLCFIYTDSYINKQQICVHIFSRIRVIT